jgi:Methylase involved in ubiquinone/menaquinone biosynthesis
MNDPSEQQAEHWERFYQEQKRPWRGISKIDCLQLEPGSKVLDIGCGNGKTVSALINMGLDVTGLDFSPSAIDHCVKTFGGKAKFTIAECDRIPFPDNSFDAVTAVHILEHLDDRQLSDTVKEIRRVLIPGGKVFVRSFAVGDSRADGKDRDVRGNGISYRYYTTEQMKEIFREFDALIIERKDETMRFGAVRVRIECLFCLPDQS